MAQGGKRRKRKGKREVSATRRIAADAAVSSPNHGNKRKLDGFGECWSTPVASAEKRQRMDEKSHLLSRYDWISSYFSANFVHLQHSAAEVSPHDAESELGWLMRQNTLDLLDSMPQNSPLRQPILHFLTKNIMAKDAAKLFETGLRTIQRAKAVSEEQVELLFMKYRQGVHRNRLDLEDLYNLDRFIDEIAPFQSGRKWRLLSITLDKFFQLYVTKMAKLHAIRLSPRVVFQRLTRDPIHHARESVCPICSSTTVSNDVKARHKQIKLEQRISFQNAISTLEDDCVVVVLDFSQLEFAKCKSLQDLIVVIFRSGQPMSIRHFIAETEKVKNDNSFVFEVLARIYEDFNSCGIRSVEMWSDGPTKHFKNTESLQWIAEQRRKRIFNFTLTWSYFCAHHGGSQCDSASAVANKVIKNNVRNLKVLPSLNELECQVSKIANVEHVSTVGHCNQRCRKCRTLDGITKFYKLIYLNDGRVEMYERSHSKKPMKTVQGSSFVIAK